MTTPFAKTPLGARLRLLRFSNAASPMVDVLSGACAAHPFGIGLDAWTVVPAMLGSAAIYHAGMIFNDVADRDEDVKTRPDRPLPSGLVSLREALTTGTILLLAAIAISVWIGHWRILAALAGVVLLYDFATKRGSALGPLLLGVARGLNFLSGWFATGSPVNGPWGLYARDETWIWGIAAGYALAIAGISFFALGEDRAWSARRAWLSTVVSLAGLLVAYFAAVKLDRGSLAESVPTYDTFENPLWIALGLFWLPVVEPASIVLGPSRPWTPDRVGQVVGAGLRSIFVFHALLFLFFNMPQFAFLCGIGYLTARILARWIPPT